MPDIYATIADQPRAVQERLREVLKLRADEPEMQAMTQKYLSELTIPDGAHVLELGCGTGCITRAIAETNGVSAVVGIDPSTILLDEARRLCRDLPCVDFQEGDARGLAHPDANFELVVSHTTLSHVPDVERALAEAYRVLKPGGRFVVFDGDYATTSIATGDYDPLQVCVDAAMHHYVNDRWLMRRLPRLMSEAGFEAVQVAGHGYVKISEPRYLVTLIERGAEAIAATGTIGPEVVAAMRAEAERRICATAFYGQIMFACLVAQKPN